MALLKLHRSLRALSALGADRTGGAAVEFALVLPVLLLVLAGVADGVRLITRGMQVNAAAQAGADYVQREGWDEAGVRAAVQAATRLTATLDPAPRQFLACVAGNAIVETAAETCPSGRPAGRYVLISTRAAFAPLMPWPGFALPDSLSGQATVRIP